MPNCVSDERCEGASEECTFGSSIDDSEDLREDGGDDGNLGGGEVAENERMICGEEGVVC